MEVLFSQHTVFDTQLWRYVGLTLASLVFKVKVKEPVLFMCAYRVTTDDVNFHPEELRQRISHHLMSIDPAYISRDARWVIRLSSE